MSKKIMTLAIFLSLIAGGGFIMLTGETAYLCEDTQQICVGTRLTTSGKTCYYTENGTQRMKRCLIEPYWQEYENEELEQIEISTVNITANLREWECIVKNGRIASYTKCYSGDREAYLGEKI